MIYKDFNTQSMVYDKLNQIIKSRGIPENELNNCLNEYEKLNLLVWSKDTNEIYFVN